MKKPRQKLSEPPFTTVHNLIFESGVWRRDPEWNIFRIGTCHGQWKATPLTYDILSIVNDKPGNGHLEGVFQFFERSCRRDKRALRVLEIMNTRFQDHLVNKRGFIRVQQHCIKLFD